jgi:DNA-binding transcriptional MerR regulator
MIGVYPLMTRSQRRLGLLSIEEVAERCGLHPEFIQRLVVLGLIDPEDDGADFVRPEMTLRIERLLRLRRDLGVNYSAAALVFDLLERIDILEERLRCLSRE